MASLGMSFKGIVSLTILLALGACAPSTARPVAQTPAEAPRAAPAPSTSTAPVDSLQTIIDAARREGSLSLVWGEGSAGGTQGTRRLAEGFNKLYDLNLDVRFTPGNDMPMMTSKSAEEYQAGRTASTDIALGYSNHMLALIEAGALEPTDWASWAPNVQDPRLLAPSGMAVAIQSSLPGITYNSQRFTGAAVPRSLEDVLKPQYKGHVGATPYAAWFDHLAASELWGPQRTVDYVARLADQASGLMRCNEEERLLSGEFNILVLDCSQRGPLRLKAQGAPIEFLVASDAPLIAPLYMAVPKNAAHPHAARLWVNYLLSREAQDLLYEFAFIDSHLVPGSRTVRLIETLEAGGAKFTQLDVEFYQRNDQKELTRILTDLQRVIQKR